ncbi:hypothetical protein ACFP1L_04600 [Lactiplantibacillus nangangensis]|uniref:Non-specific protein-tyrosine kinase n=1 Tax=Lactiplantibacillus nangangensis TaxID=2559917 RepID=A0ABW1SHX7_9LACO|nr:CpsD/CapB family tyrosine-protein kinase [Lactiplantibacillus nangangensis]
MSDIKNGIRKINSGLSNVGEKANIITFISLETTRVQQIIIANMALMYGQAGMKTVIVDSDFGNNSLIETFGMKNQQGLSNYLNDQSISLNDITNRVSGQNTSVISSGNVEIAETKYLIGDPRFASLINQLSLDYEKVLINTPMFEHIDTCENYILVSDGILLVSNSKTTNKRTVYKIIKALRKNDAKLIGYIDVKEE